MKRWFQRAVLASVWRSFVMLCLAFFAFGLGSLNLFLLLRANVALIGEHGWQALMDGGAQQLFELLSSGVLSVASWIVFKACEHRLVHWLNEE